MKDYEDNILENSVKLTGRVILYQAGSLQVLKMVNGNMAGSAMKMTVRRKIAAYWTREVTALGAEKSGTAQCAGRQMAGRNPEISA